MVQKLHEESHFNFRVNLKSALTNVSELPEGFLCISNELCDKLDLLDEIFGERAIKALAELLPKLEEYENPLEGDLEHYGNYVNAINKLFLKYDKKAAKIAITDCINFVEKFFPYLNSNYFTCDETIISIYTVCKNDEYSSLVLKRLLDQHGNTAIKFD